MFPGHHVVAKRLASILPSMSVDESLETTRNYSVACMLFRSDGSLLSTRPFRTQCPASIKYSVDRRFRRTLNNTTPNNAESIMTKTGRPLGRPPLARLIPQ